MSHVSEDAVRKTDLGRRTPVENKLKPVAAPKLNNATEIVTGPVYMNYSEFDEMHTRLRIHSSSILPLFSGQRTLWCLKLLSSCRLELSKILS